MGNISQQLKYSGRGQLDEKTSPVDKVTDLENIDKSERKDGMVVLVLNKDTDNIPQYYICRYVQDGFKKVYKWVKFKQIIDCGEY